MVKIIRKPKAQAQRSVKPRNSRSHEVAAYVAVAAVVLVVYGQVSGFDFVSLDDESYVAYHGLGKALAEAGEIEEAIEQYNKAIAINPDYDPAHGDLGILLSKIGEYEGALKHQRRAVELKPTLPAHRANLGQALIDCGRLEDGVREIAYALRLKPDMIGARTNLAYALLRLGRLREAQRQCTEALHYEPRSTGDVVIGDYDLDKPGGAGVADS